MRVGYFGPEGTFTQEALIADTRGTEPEMVPLPTIYDTVMAVHSGAVERALVPIENSLEGSVNATLDALAMETEDVAIVGEVVHPIRHCLIARTALELSAIEVVVSHPQANAQCARFIRTRLPQARGAGRHLHRGRGAHGGRARRTVGGARQPGGGRALRLPGAARRGGGRRRERDPLRLAGAHRGRGGAIPTGPFKTAIVFWGVGSEAPGWLVACLSQFAQRGVNLTRIESRPRKQGLGRYMFFADLEGRDDDPPIVAGLAALAEHVERLRVLGSFPSA